MTSKLFLVILLWASITMMVSAKGQMPVPLHCLAKDGLNLITCAVQCLQNESCLQKCGAVGLAEAVVCYVTKVAEGPQQAQGAIEAVAMITSSSDTNRIEGSLQFLQSHSHHTVETYIQGTITGLPPGKLHGLHIHYNSSCGNHRNQEGARYLGLGNIAAGANGLAEFSVAKSSLTVVGGAHSVLGHSIVVHPQPDYRMGSTETTGKYCTQKVLACGIIQL